MSDGDDYLVFAADCCGDFDSRRARTFASALEYARELRTKYPDRKRVAVVVQNNSQADNGFDGLTDEERDEVP